jgi:type IV fimbrial biogenesis protein FimT
VRLSFDSAAACYVVHTGGSADCRCDAAGAPVCSHGAEPLRTVHWATLPVSLGANVSSMAIEGQFGTVTPTATVRFQGRSGATLHQVVNIMGRVRSCAATPGLPGYKAC